MIDSVKIGFLTYAVLLADRPDEVTCGMDETDARKWLLGEIAFGKARIYIDSEQHDEVKRATLMHEIVHGILRQGGYYDECDNEGLVNLLSFALVDLIRANPQLITYVQEQGE